MRLLLVEDEKKVAEFISRGLRTERYAVDVAYDGESGWKMAQACRYDLIILDLMLPRLNGTQLLAQIRKEHASVPILILTARDSDRERTEAKAVRADDYLTKPFAFSELAVRIRTLLRPAPGKGANRLQVADLEIDRRTQMVRRAGRAIELRPKEYALLEYLAANPGRVFSCTMIVEHVWDQSFAGATNIVDVYVQHLRRKVDEPFPTKLIHSVRGVGYAIGVPAESGRGPGQPETAADGKT